MHVGTVGLPALIIPMYIYRRIHIYVYRHVLNIHIMHIDVVHTLLDKSLYVQ